jgi:hypothetical protein
MEGTSMRSVMANHLPSSPDPVMLARSSADRSDLNAEPAMIHNHARYKALFTMMLNFYQIFS